MKENEARDSILARRAREREADREAGRPERGLFTGRGSRRMREADLDDEQFDDDIDDRGFDRDDADEDVPRTGAKRTVMAAIRQIPAYARLMVGLLRDSRVSRVDRFLVIAAAAYMLSPLDFIPDLIPFFGQTDDVFLLVLALQRLIDNAGRRVLLDHWNGDPRELSDVSLTGLVSAAGFFLPAGIRKRLRRIADR